MKTAVEHLEKYGIRPSIQRTAVMNYLLKNRTHPTADEIYSALEKDIPRLSRTTIYNTLHLLHEHGAILMLNIDPSTTHFDGYTHPHAHFYCTKCGKVHDIEFDDTQFIERNRPRNAHTLTDAQLYYRGICDKCAEAEKVAQ